MAQTQSARDSSDPDATGGAVPHAAGAPDTPTAWGNNGLVGDGRYRLTGRLGRGGMAEVFAAEDIRLGRAVAVKLLRSDLAEDPTAKARFTREAQSVAGLNHHAVVAVYDSGEDVVGLNTVPYIVMELVNGRTIRELLQSADAPPSDQALTIVSGVLEALAYSHQHGIVHRDIKPGNVIITHTGTVKVMDFGIARALHSAQSTMTQTGMVMGTPQYLSPEQALGKAVDTRSDLYAVGCLLYELLALRPPFTGETPLSVVYQHVQDDPRPPSEVSVSVPPELDGLVMRSLAKDPDDRFQSAEEMRGLVQYALRMLREQGSHTGGLWNTGAVTATGTTPAAGVPLRGAGDTAQTAALGPPLLMGRPGGDDSGGFEGGPVDRRQQGGGNLKYALIAFLAVLAVAAGLFLALPENPDPKKPDRSRESSTSTPTQQETSEEPDTRSTTGDDPEEVEEGGGGGGGLPQPTEPPSYEETPTETDEAPSTPTEPADPTTESSTGSTDEETATGDVSSGLDGGGGSTTEGTSSEGSTTEGTSTEGSTTDGGTTEGETTGGESDGGAVSGSDVGGSAGTD